MCFVKIGRRTDSSTSSGRDVGGVGQESYFASRTWVSVQEQTTVVSGRVGHDTVGVGVTRVVAVHVDGVPITWYGPPTRSGVGSLELSKY